MKLYTNGRLHNFKSSVNNSRHGSIYICSIIFRCKIHRKKMVMEELRKEIETEIERSKNQLARCQGNTLKLIAEGRLIAYKNVLVIMDRAEEERKSQPLPQDVKWDS